MKQDENNLAIPIGKRLSIKCLGAYAAGMLLAALSASAAETETVGIVKAEVYTGVSGTPVQNLFDNANFPDSPNRVQYLSGLSFGQPGFGGTVGDNYGVKITGVLIPPKTGNYFFFIRSDDASLFYLNTTGSAIPDPLLEIPIAEEADCCDPFREPDSGDASTTATAIPLEAGKKYGFTYIVKEGGGGDWGQVAWRMEGDTTPANRLGPIVGPYVAAVADATGADVTITSDLQPSISVAETDRLTLTVKANTTVSPTAPGMVGQPTYQWFRDGKPIPSYRATHTVNLVRPDQNGAKYKVLVMVPGKVAESQEATITVTDDVTPPSIVRVRGNRDLNSMTVVFSEPVEAASAANVANYSVSPSLTLSAPVTVNATTVRFTTSPQTSGTEYTVTVNNVKDQSAKANPITADSKAAFKAWIRYPGFVTAEFFNGINGTPVANLLNAQKFIDNAPDETRFLPNFDGPNGLRNNYGTRVTAWLVPPESGNYNFFIRSDDASQLYINPTGEAIPDPNVDAPVAEELDCCDAFSEPESGDSATTAVPIALEAGKKYGVLFLHKEGGGGDWFQVAWRKEGDTTAASALRPMSGSLFETMVDATGASIEFTTPPAGIDVVQNRVGTFNVQVTASTTSIGYQWLKNGVAIAGANSASYTIPPAQLSDDDAKYSVRVTIPGLQQVSSEATLNVIPDTTPPSVVGAGAFAGASTVAVAFDEALDPASAEAAANYKVSGATVSAVKLHAGRVAELTLAAAVGANFTVTVNGVKDLAGNSIANATATGKISDLSAQDLGDPGTDPVQLGRAFTWGTGYFVTGGGTDIWGNADQGYFVYKQFTGPFDMRARVDSLVGGDEWGKATLMARESLDAGSRNQAVLITKPAPYEGNAFAAENPSKGGVNVYNHQWRNATDGSSGSKAGGERISPTVFPSWIRLVRESTASNEMKSYISYNGTDWIAYHTHTIPDEVLPESLFLGMAVTTHDNLDTHPMSEVVYENFSIQPYQAIVDPKLSITIDAGQISIAWEAGTLESSTSVTGPYAPVAGATSPLKVAPTGTTFYRVKL